MERPAHAEGEKPYCEEVISADALPVIAQAVKQLLQSNMRHIQLHGRAVETLVVIQGRRSFAVACQSRLVVSSELKQI